MDFLRVSCRLIAVCSAFAILLHRQPIKEPPKIAIIGGGIGGASAAYFLSELAPERIQIDLYEARVLGGRIATTTINNQLYEIGATIIHARNQYMDYFCQKYGLTKLDDRSGGLFALYDGKKFPFISSNWEIITFMKMVWRYGRSIVKSFGMVDKMLKHFDSIYEWQDMSKPYENMKSMISEMNPDFLYYLNKTTRNGFMEQGLSEKFIDEIVLASTKCNYGQFTNIHQFVGSVSLAGIQPGLWSVNGGNKLIVEKLVNDSRADVVFKKVVKIELQDDETFTVRTLDSARNYDAVIIATPLTSDAKLPIKFFGFPNEIKLNGQYQKIIATIVHGTINYKYFSFASENSVPDLILSVGNDTFFNSLGRIFPVKYDADDDRSVWKVFSCIPLKEQELDNLFSERYETQVFDWLAYPSYTTYDFDKTNDSFVLHKNLYYINAVEWAASAMEMSAVAGKNAALLTYKSLFPYAYSRHQTYEGLQDVHEDL